MFYVIHGTDTQTTRHKLHTLVDSLMQKKPDASVLWLDAETFNVSALDEYILGQGLFESKQIVVFDNLWANADAKAAILDRVKDIGNSPNIFIVLEGALDVATLKKLSGAAEKVEEVQAPERAKKDSFNIFSLSDALASRDRKKLWMLLQKALRAGLAPEEIHGTLFWQTKTMVLAGKAHSANEAGLKPFVFSKAKRALAKYSQDDAQKMSRDLVVLYHESRRGGLELPLALERFALSI